MQKQCCERSVYEAALIREETCSSALELEVQVPLHDPSHHEIKSALSNSSRGIVDLDLFMSSSTWIIR